MVCSEKEGNDLMGKEEKETGRLQVADGQLGYCHIILTHPLQSRSDPLRQDSGTEGVNRGESVGEQSGRGISCCTHDL